MREGLQGGRIALQHSAVSMPLARIGRVIDSNHLRLRRGPRPSTCLHATLSRLGPSTGTLSRAMPVASRRGVTEHATGVPTLVWLRKAVSHGPGVELGGRSPQSEVQERRRQSRAFRCDVTAFTFGLLLPAWRDVPEPDGKTRRDTTLRPPLAPTCRSTKHGRKCGHSALAVVSVLGLRGEASRAQFRARRAAWATRSIQEAIPSNRAAVPPRIAVLSSSLNPGKLRTRSTSVLVQGNG